MMFLDSSLLAAHLPPARLLITAHMSRMAPFPRAGTPLPRFVAFVYGCPTRARVRGYGSAIHQVLSISRSSEGW
jgi:hypothetical protein